MTRHEGSLPWNDCFGRNFASRTHHFTVAMSWTRFFWGIHLWPFGGVSHQGNRGNKPVTCGGYTVWIYMVSGTFELWRLDWSMICIHIFIYLYIIFYFIILYYYIYIYISLSQSAYTPQGMHSAQQNPHATSAMFGPFQVAEATIMDREEGHIIHLIFLSHIFRISKG